jgi:hypothetical protein
MEYEYDHDYDYDHDDRHTVDPAGDQPILAIALILGHAYLQCAASGLRFGVATTKRIVKGQIQLLEHLLGKPRAVSRTGSTYNR